MFFTTIGTLKWSSFFSDLRASPDIFLGIEMMHCNYYRNLWWEKGEFNEKAKWDEVTIPYVLAKGITLEDYEERVDKFKIHGCWEWSNGKVIIYELLSESHKVCIGLITKEIIKSCINADGTDAEVYSYGSTRTHADSSAKEADDSFRPEKSAVTSPNGSDGK
ncbi:9732_t:CDS:2, partial [Funneliformis mosseae]